MLTLNFYMSSIDVIKVTVLVATTTYSAVISAANAAAGSASSTMPQ